MQNQPLLSISILVSNRIDTIRNCMESIKPLLTGIPCELVAIDTVGEATDGSIAVVREYTEKVYRFEWCNDFAAARNFGMEKCSGKWFMFMDDDEWFEDVGEIVEFFVSGEYKKYHCANYKIHSYSDYKGNYSVATLFRMVERTPEIRFTGKVHEYLNPLKAPAKEFSAWIHHYGYVFDSEEEKQAHSRRNICLLEPEFLENPWDMHVRVQLLQEYVYLPELKEKAAELCEETLFSADKQLYKTNEFQWALLAYVRMANKENDFEEVVRRAELVRKQFPLSALADVAISTIEMNARCNLKQYVTGMAVFEHAKERRKFLLENPEQKQHLFILDLATFMEDSVYCDLLKFGIRCFYNAGNVKRAKELSKERLSLLKSPALTISVLISNHKGTLRRCLDSVKPLLDEIPSELIIVDIATEEQKDGSLEIAKEYTNHIVPFVWNDDFAAARNAGLQAAKGEWFLYLNAEEWFEDVEEIKEFFLGGEYLEYNSATYLSRNYKDKEGGSYHDETVGRMVRRAKTTEFVGSIDEAFNNMYTPNKTFSAYVHHYGFVYYSQEEKENRMQYKRKLLRRDLERYPTYFRNRAQLVAVLSIQDPREAVDICIDTLAVCKEQKESNPYQWQIAVLYGLLESLQLQTVAEEMYCNLKQQDLFLPVAEQVVCYRLARIHILAGDYASAYLYVKRFFELLEPVAMGEIPQEFRKYQGEEWQKEMLHLGGFCAWQTKSYVDAWIFYGSMDWEVLQPEAEDTLWKLFALAEEYVDNAVFYNIIKRVMNNVHLKPVLGRMMQGNPQVKQRINAVLATQKKKETKLSIGILVSNRMGTIRKCMESITPLLKELSAELVALDTVGKETDGSINVVREYTDKVYPYEWCRDFADARNTCLNYATGEWFLFLDDDEWFDNVDDLIAFFKNGDCEKYHFGTFLIRNYSSADKYSTAIVTRLVRRTENIHFVGKVHEMIHELCPPGKQFECYLHHRGYVFASEEERKKHQERNMSILQQEIEENGISARRCAQMAQELLSCKETAAQGYEYCMKYLPVLKEQGLEKDSCVQWMLTASVRYFRMQQNYEEAKRQAEKIRTEYQLSEFAELAVYGVLVELAVKAYDVVMLPELVQGYVTKWNWLKTHPEAARAQAQLDLPKYLEEEYYNQVVQAGIQAAKILELKNEPEDTNQPLVTVSLLVSNRKDTIRRCLESVKPLLDSVPSELIAVDTVGEENSDGSLDIVKEYTNQIVRFEWCNDFAAARNAGLERAKGKWFLYLDDDEWFEDITPIIRFFSEGEYKNYGRAWYYVRNYQDVSGNKYVDTIADRMSVITKDSKFEGRVHECLVPCSSEIKRFSCYAHHYGYAYASKEELQKHVERNCVLLEAEMKDNPEDARFAAQLAVEYAAGEKFEIAINFCKDWLETNNHQDNNPFVQYIIVMWLRVTMNAGNWEEAEKLLYHIEQTYHLQEIPQLACLAESIYIVAEQKNYKEVLGRAKSFFKLKEEIEKKAWEMDSQQILDLTKYLKAEEQERVMQHVISAIMETGQYDMADEVFGKVDWLDEKKKPFAFMLQLTEFYGKSGRDDIFFKYAEKIKSNPRMKSPFAVAIDEMVRNYPERQKAVKQWLVSDCVNMQKKQNSEMELLAIRLKKNIENLIASGQTETAGELLRGLKELLPQDAEIEKLEKLVGDKKI